METSTELAPQPDTTDSGKQDWLAEITRLEAFSDGAFAIIITLLVIEIHRPHAGPGMLAWNS